MRAPPGRLARLCQKELRETLRDRRTMITLVLMPLLVYPVLSMTLNRFLLSGNFGGEAKYVLGVASEREGEWLVGFLEQETALPPEVIREAADGEVAGFEVFSPEAGMTLEEALTAGLIDAAVAVQFEPDLSVSITARRGNNVSLAARRILAERLLYFEKSRQEAMLGERLGMPPPRIDVAIRAVGEDKPQSLLATIVPLVLVLMTITGAVYPAIDLTAGERERGTMEALIASPVPRATVLFAKYVAVVTVALLTALANLGAMFTTLWAGGLLPMLMGGESGFPWGAVSQILVLLILFSAFFSAVLLALTSFARSFKEAQAYLIPLMLLSLTPGVLSLFPGVRLTAELAVVPLLNIILLSREILAGTYAAVPAIVAVFATMLYASAALGVASRLFGSDAVLRGSEISLGAALQRPAEPRAVPTLSEAAMTLALIFPTYYVASNVLTRTAPEAMVPRLTLNALVLCAVFGGLPWFAVWYCRDEKPTTYRWRRPGWLAVIGALLMGLGLWTWAHELFVIADQVFGIRGLDASKIAGVRAALERLRETSPVVVVAALALTPAVVEEFCFRGYLFSALRQRTSALTTILVTSLLFGIFHVLTGSTLLLERFLPTTMLGMVLGLVAWRTGSVWPGIVLHFTHNAFLELVACYGDTLEAWGIGLQEQTHLPWSWLAIGTGLTVAGALAVAISGRGAALSGLGGDSPGTDVDSSGIGGAVSKTSVGPDERAAIGLSPSELTDS